MVCCSPPPPDWNRVKSLYYSLIILGWGIELLAVSCVVLYGAYTIIKKAWQGKEIAFLRPGPMLTPKDSWGPRPDSGLPTVAQVNAAFEGETS